MNRKLQKKRKDSHHITLVGLSVLAALSLMALTLTGLWSVVGATIGTVGSIIGLPGRLPGQLTFELSPLLLGPMIPLVYCLVSTKLLLGRVAAHVISGGSITAVVTREDTHLTCVSVVSAAVFVISAYWSSNIIDAINSTIR